MTIVTIADVVERLRRGANERQPVSLTFDPDSALRLALILEMGSARADLLQMFRDECSRLIIATADLDGVLAQRLGRPRPARSDVQEANRAPMRVKKG
jgi:hypothetical protein